MSKAQGNSVKVVQVKDGSYQLNKDALHRILLQPQVKDLPVVVVSVAGAYRGGKSFLLNFFLRYINAPRSSQLDGSWLGDGEESLDGFNWCSSGLNSTGISVWSEPIVTTLHTGDKVAVILLDTHGTFDSHSTVKDCSTIFALSTLLSSVQIYNLSQIIREDDLQHLQLFTEYGNLLKDKNRKPFQALEIIVSDWMYLDDGYPYGSTAGNAYLEEKLKIRDNMSKELTDVREYIRSSYQQLSCFLMPHPGVAVPNSNFIVQIQDLDPDFKENIHEFMSHMFGATTRMMPLEIEGQSITASSLYTYFETYLKAFNSDEVSSPKRIMEAKPKSDQLSVLTEASRLYKNSMEADCGSSQPSLPTQDVKDLHEKYAARAIATFINKKKLGSRIDADNHLQKLMQELVQSNRYYVNQNVSKLMKQEKDALKLYDTRIGEKTSVKMLCVHPLDLEEAHLDAFQTAVDLFDRNRRNITGKEDEARAIFIQKLESQYRSKKNLNDRNNKDIVEDLLQQYKRMMDINIRSDAVTQSELQRVHQDVYDHVMDAFESKRDKPNCYDTDEFKSSLIEMITVNFNEIRAMNLCRHISKANDAGIKAYDEHLANIWDPKEVCLHPGDLEEEHGQAQRKAMAELEPIKVMYGNVCLDPAYEEEKLVEQLEERHSEIKKTNDVANAIAVTAAVNKYCEEMDHKCSLSSVLIPYSENKSMTSMKDIFHNESKEKAIELFLKNRRASSSDAKDEFMSHLQERIAAKRANY